MESHNQKDNINEQFFYAVNKNGTKYDIFNHFFEGRIKKENRMGRKLTGSFTFIPAPYTVGVVYSYQTLVCLVGLFTLHSLFGISDFRNGFTQRILQTPSHSDASGCNPSCCRMEQVLSFLTRRT